MKGKRFRASPNTEGNGMLELSSNDDLVNGELAIPGIMEKDQM